MRVATYILSILGARDAPSSTFTSGAGHSKGCFLCFHLVVVSLDLLFLRDWKALHLFDYISD